MYKVYSKYLMRF